MVTTQEAGSGILRRVRQRRGLTLTKVAELAGVDAGNLSRAERGLGGLSIDSLSRVASVLALTSDEVRLYLAVHRLDQVAHANAARDDDGGAA